MHLNSKRRIHLTSGRRCRRKHKFCTFYGWQSGNAISRHRRRLLLVFWRAVYWPNGILHGSHTHTRPSLIVRQIKTNSEFDFVIARRCCLAMCIAFESRLTRDMWRQNLATAFEWVAWLLPIQRSLFAAILTAKRMLLYSCQWYKAH